MLETFGVSVGVTEGLCEFSMEDKQKSPTARVALTYISLLFFHFFQSSVISISFTSSRVEKGLFGEF